MLHLLNYLPKQLSKYIKEKNLDAEILVSDNNSTDNSVKIAEKMHASQENW